MNDRTSRPLRTSLLAALTTACHEPGPSPADVLPMADANSGADTRAAFDVGTLDIDDGSALRDATLDVDAVVADGIVAAEVDTEPGAPRPIAPLSTATVSSRRPLLRWLLAEGAEGARVEVCRDRACTRVITTFAATGTSGRSEVRPAAWHRVLAASRSLRRAGGIGRERHVAARRERAPGCPRIPA